MSCLRMTIGRWDLDLESPEARESSSASRPRRGRVSPAAGLRPLPSDARRPAHHDRGGGVGIGSPRDRGRTEVRAWLTESGIREKLTMETYAGEIVAAS